MPENVCLVRWAPLMERQRWTEEQTLLKSDLNLNTTLPFKLYTLSKVCSQTEPWLSQLGVMITVTTQFSVYPGGTHKAERSLIWVNWCCWVEGG